MPSASLEHGRQSRGHLAADLVVGSVDLGHHGLQHRRPGRHLHHRDPGARAARASGVSIARAATASLMTAAVALVLVLEHHQHVAFPGLFAQIVVAHHAIEVERLRGAGIGLHGNHLRHLA